MNIGSFLVELIIYLLLVFSPIPFGSVDELWRFLISTTISFAGIVLFVQKIFNPITGFVVPKGYPFFLLTLIFTFVLGAFSPLPQQAIRSSIFFSTILLLPIIVINNFNSKGALKRLLMVCFAQALFLSFYGLLKSASLSPVPGEHYRLHFSSTFYNHNHFAGFIEMILPFFAAPILISSNKSRQFFYFLPLSLFFFAMLLLTFSRGGIIGFLLGFLIIIYVFSKRIKNVLPIVLVTIIIVYLGFSLKGTLEKIFSTESVALSGQARFLIVKSSLLSALERPFTGWGAGNFEFAYLKFRDGIDGIVNYAHNDYIQAILELGIPLGIFFMILLTTTYIYCIKEIKKRRDRFYYYTGIASSAGILSIAFHELVDFNLRIPANAVYFSILFAVLILSTFVDRKATNVHPPVIYLPSGGVKSNIYKIIFGIFLIFLFLSATKIIFNEIKYRRAMEYHRNGDFVNSAEILKTIKESMFSRPEYYYMYCRVLASEAFIINSHNGLLQAIDACKDAINSNPYNPLYVIDTAELLKRTGLQSEALRYYKAAQEIDPNNLYLKLFYFEALIQSQKNDEAFKLFQTAIQRSPQKIGLFLEIIKNDRKLLIDFLKLHLEKNPEDLEIFLKYLAGEGLREEYLELFSRFFADGRIFTSQEFYNNAGNYLFSRNPAEAERILREGIRNHPDSFTGYQILMNLLFALKKYDDLLKLADEVERRFNSTDAYYYKAMVYSEKNELSLALRYAKLCIGRNVKNIYRILLYNIYMKMEMEFEALKSLGEPTNYTAEDVYLLYLRAGLLEKWGKYEEALQDYRRILDFQNNPAVAKKIIELEDKKNAKAE